MRIKQHKSFDKKFSKLPRKIKDAALVRVGLFLEDSKNPLLNNHSLHGKYNGWRSINITGDYRLLYKEEAPDTVILIDIGTHADLYN